MTFDPVSAVYENEDHHSLSGVEEQRVPFLVTESIEESRSALLPDRRSIVVKIFSHCCYALSVVLFVGGLWRQPSDAECVQKLNAWCECSLYFSLIGMSWVICISANNERLTAPMLDAIKYHDVRQSALSESIYIGPPSDIMETAWDQLWKCKEAYKI